jgi:hypothetical protein
VIMTAGEPRKPRMTRIDLINKNLKVFKSVVKRFVQHAPNCKLMLATNPVDIKRARYGIPRMLSKKPFDSLSERFLFKFYLQIIGWPEARKRR